MEMTTSPVTRTRVFVFGSNLAGIHGAGAALAARQEWGAQLGVGKGLTGRAYGIPTKDFRIKTLPLPVVEGHVKDFLAFAKSRPDLVFEVTRVGCGLAGYKDAQIAPLFKGAPENCVFDPSWDEYLDTGV